MANSPTFTRTPVAKGKTMSVANTARDGTGTIISLIEAGQNGTRIERVHFKAAGTTTSGSVRLFHFAGGRWRLMDELLVSAITVGAATLAWSDVWVPVGGYITLARGEALGVAPHNGETFNVFAEGGDF